MPWTTYLGKYVLDRTAVQANRPRQTVKNITIGRDFQRQARYTYERPGTAFERDFQLLGQADMLDLRKFWRAHKGMLTALWLPSWTRDFTLTQGELNGASLLRAKRSNVQLLDNRTRHIYLPRIGFMCRVTGITDMTTYYSLGLSAALTADVLETDVVCILHYVRCASDTFQLRNLKSAGIWQVTLGFEELPMEVPAS